MKDGLDRIDHIGLIVDDLDAAKALLTAVVGVAWGEDVVLGGEMEFRGRRMPWSCRNSYSRGGPLNLELIEQLDRRHWETLTNGRQANHICLWTEDVAAESERLLAAGLARETNGLGSEGELSGWAFHLSPSPGWLIELLSTDFRPVMTAWAAGEIPDTGQADGFG